MRIRLLVAGAYIALVGLGLLSDAGRAGAILIDEFSTDQTLLWLGGPGSTSSQVSGSEILGGERDMEVTLISNIGIVMAASGGSLNYLQAGISQGTGRIVWDGVDGSPVLDPTGLGGVDFTRGGADDKVAIPLLSNNFSAPITLTAYTDAANYSTAVLSLPGSVPPQVKLSVLFTDFSAAAGAGADFTNIGAFSLDIDGSTVPGLAAEFPIVNPEPSTATLLFFGILGIIAIRRCGWTA